MASASTMYGRKGVNPVSVSRAASGSIVQLAADGAGQVEAVHQLLPD